MSKNLSELSEIEIQDEILALARVAEQWAATTWPCVGDCGCVFCLLRPQLDELDRRRNFLREQGELSHRLQNILRGAGMDRHQMQHFADKVARKHKIKRWCNVGTREDYLVLVEVVKVELRKMRR